MVKLKREILREAPRVSLDGLVEGDRRHTVEYSQIAIEYDALAANGVDGRESGIRHGNSRA
jgi:hypothetical protein